MTSTASKVEVMRRKARGFYSSYDILSYAGFSDYKEVVALYANINIRKENGETALCSFPSGDDEGMSGDDEDMSGDDEDIVRVLFEKYAEKFLKDATEYAILRVPVKERC